MPHTPKLMTSRKSFDVLTKRQRSYNMSRIRGTDTEPEISLRRALRRHGLRLGVSNSKVIGRPDLTHKRAKVAIFVDGCFWHGCPRHMQWPRSNALFWRRKILGNMSRDKSVTKQLVRDGWTVVRIWEHDLPKKLDAWCRRVQITIERKIKRSFA